MRASSITLFDAAGNASESSAGALVFGVKGPANQLGLPLSLEQVFGFSIQANFLTGSPAGTLELAASNDGVNFSPIPGTSYTVTGVGSQLWNVPGPMYKFVQMTWTPAGGGSSGPISAIAYVRGF